MNTIKANLSPVRTLGIAEVEQAVEVLCDAFFDYPVMRFVLGSPQDYSERLTKLITFFVMARVYRDEVLLGVDGESGLGGVGVVSFPGRSKPTKDLAKLRMATWDSLGSEAKSRYDAFSKAASAFDLDEPHVHLNMIGVRQAAQGKGIGGLLLRAVQAISDADDESVGITLSTETEANVPLYHHAGYEVLGAAEVSAELTTWAFFLPKSS